MKTNIAINTVCQPAPGKTLIYPSRQKQKNSTEDFNFLSCPGTNIQHFPKTLARGWCCFWKVTCSGLFQMRGVCPTFLRLSDKPVCSLSRSLLSVITAEAVGNWERNGTAGCISSENTLSAVQRQKRVLYFVLCCLLLVSLPVLLYMVVLSLLKPSN